MKANSWWAAIVHAFNVLILSSPDERSINQKPIGHPHGHPHSIGHDLIAPGFEVRPLDVGPVEDGKAYLTPDGYPWFGTPKNPQEGTARLKCVYPDMQGWVGRHGPEDRQCWLKEINGPGRIDISTDYEDLNLIPKGQTRKYTLIAGEEPISPDGTTLEFGKVFNRTYPGPWIEACWGDWIEVTVVNKLRWNGTSIHWHGIRQFETNQHDGVNGITECPIAPGDSYTYRFRAMQYGSAWYHSHYSLQYGDGLAGPLTIYGPSTVNYDDDLTFRPILMTDWNHRSVFEDWPIMLQTQRPPQMTNILLNGTGQFGPTNEKTPAKYQLTLTEEKKHMLILVNTAVDTTFVFSIDNHILEVIAADFVHIHPYNTTNLKIGIGQRYHVIVRGLETPKRAERNGNFWMRVIPARKCSKFAYGPDENMGIIRYNSTDKKNPLSDPYLFDTTCGDEPKDKLIPWQKWTVKDPVNIDPSWDNTTKIPPHKSYQFVIHRNKNAGPPYIPDDKVYTRWSMHEAPFRINFSEPIILHLNRTDEFLKRPYLDIVTYDEPNKENWIWMVMINPETEPAGDKRSFVPLAHPMHLHGHDFAILAQSSDPWFDDQAQDRRGDEHLFTPDKLNCDNKLLNCNNPPRRDVVLLPLGGYVIIAFKADNPGAWILHCHIAFHASSGLAMQVLENRHLIEKYMNKDRDSMKERCRKWNEWHGDTNNHWDWHNHTQFQDDSGV